MSGKERNTIFNAFYWPSNGQTEPFENIWNFFSKKKITNKVVLIADDFNLNLFYHNTCKKVQDFSILIYENGMIARINDPTRVTRMTASAIYCILTSSFIDRNFKAVIIKNDLQHSFPI